MRISAAMSVEDDHIYYDVAMRLIEAASAREIGFMEDYPGYWGVTDKRDAALMYAMCTKFTSLPPSERLVLVTAGF